MKNLVLVALLLVSTRAFCKKKPKLLFNHVGQMVNHAPKMRYLLEGRTDLFEDDEYICTPGDEHHAPTCQKFVDWWVADAVAYTEFKLDDGSTVIVTNNPSGFEDHEPWKHDKTTITLRFTVDDLKHPLSQLALDWDTEDPMTPLPDGATRTFHYALDAFGNIYPDWLEASREHTAAIDAKYGKHPK